jgi:hypothetical protein
MGQERLGPSYFFISLVLGPLNRLLWYERGSELRECPMAGEANWEQASPGLGSGVERQRVQ